MLRRDPRLLLFGVLLVPACCLPARHAVPNIIIPATGEPLPKDLIICPLSGYLQRKGITALVQLKSHDTNTVPTHMDVEYRLAGICGYLIILEDPEASQALITDKRGTRHFVVHNGEFYDLLDALLELGFLHFEKRTAPETSWLIPPEFTGPPNKLNQFLDGSLATEFVEYLDTWYENEDDNGIAERRNAETNKRIADAKALRTKLAAQVASLTAERDQIRVEIKRLHEALSRPGPDRDAFGDRHRMFLDRPYPEDADFYIPMHEKHFERFDTRTIHGFTIKVNKPNGYLHRDMIKTFESFVTAEHKALKKMGLFGIELVSVARTPMEQLHLQQNRQPGQPVGGMFSSNHVFGMAFDFQTIGTALDYRASRANKSRLSRFTRLLKKHGLVIPLRSDPNHVVLKKFRKDAGYANDIKFAVLSDYIMAMSKERGRQNDLRRSLAQSAEAMREELMALDQEIVALQKEIDALMKEIARLNGTKAGLTLKLERRNSSYDGHDPHQHHEHRTSDGRLIRIDLYHNRDCVGVRVRDSRTGYDRTSARCRTGGIGGGLRLRD